jgi:RNA polymerase sigma-70 factor, ECF subfamily
MSIPAAIAPSLDAPRLHALLLRPARFEAARRRDHVPYLRDKLEEIAQEAAADALMRFLARLDDFRDESRVTTLAYKFALLETAVKLRKRACTPSRENC